MMKLKVNVHRPAPGPGCMLPIINTARSLQPEQSPAQALGQCHAPRPPLLSTLELGHQGDVKDEVPDLRPTGQRGPAPISLLGFHPEVSPSHQEQNPGPRTVQPGCSESKPANHFSCCFIECHGTKHPAEITQQLCEGPSSPPITVT